MTRDRWLAVAAAAALALAALAAGLRLAGPIERDTELGRFSFQAAPDPRGGVDVYVPIADWGIRAPALHSLFRLDVEFRALDRRGALELAGGDPAVFERVEDDLASAARSAVLRGFAWGLGAVLLGAGAIHLAGGRSRASRRLALAAAGTGAVVAVASVGLAAATFDTREFSEPSFYGRGAELAQLLEFFGSQGTEHYESTFETTLTRFSAYVSDDADPAAGADRTVLFGSDLHDNALVLPALSRFAEGQPVLLAGDFGHEGNESEARLLAGRIADLAPQVVAVSGNHDSSALMRSLAREGVIVLQQEGRLQADGSVVGPPLVEIEGGLTVAGFPDPLEWEGVDPGSPERVFAFPELEDGEEREAQAKAELVAWFGALAEAPDVLMVHQSGLAKHLAGELSASGYEHPLVIVTGHNHEQEIDDYGDVVVVNGGTLGAGGLLGAGQEAAGLGQLHFGAFELDSLDLIEVEPLSGQAQAERVVLRVACPPGEATAEEPCHHEP